MRSRRPASRRRSRTSAAVGPSLTPIDHPATQAAARALEATFGRAPVFIREGGSIPVCASFATILGLPVVLLGFTQPDDHAHAPNEWMDLDNYETAIRAVVRALRRAGRRPRSDGVRLRRPSVRTWGVRVGGSGGVPSATLCATAPSRRYAPREHRSRRSEARIHRRRRPGASTTDNGKHGAPFGARRPGRPERQGRPAGPSREYQPVPLGFTPLDKTIGGGLRAGELLLIGGAQGTGKTTMALQMARNIASGGQANVLYICFEHDEPYLLNRLIAMESALAHLPHKTGAIKIVDVRKEILGHVDGRGRRRRPAGEQPASAPVARPDRPLRPEPVPDARLADGRHDRQHAQARPAAPRAVRRPAPRGLRRLPAEGARRSPSRRTRPRRSPTSSTASRTSPSPRTCRW